MGKKKRNKQIREIAAQLPKMKYETTYKELFKGSDVLLPAGVLVATVAGREILAGKTYVNSQKVKMDVNHYRRMKSMANKSGVKGLAEYIFSVNRMVNKQQNQK